MINTLYIALFIILVAGIITLTVLLYREKFTPAPTLAATPISPIPVSQNLLFCDKDGNLNIFKTDDFNSYLTKVNNALIEWGSLIEWSVYLNTLKHDKPVIVYTYPIAALPNSPIPGGRNLLLSDQINNDLIEWSRNFDDWIYDVKLHKNF